MKIALLLLLLAAQLASAQSPDHVQSLPPKQLFLAELPDASLSTTAVSPLFQESTYGEKKSVFRAVVYSLLLPGMGELYVDNYGMGKYFTMAEGALWITWGGLTSYGNWTQNDARAFAVQHAGINPDGRSDQYFIDIGNFLSAEQYNTAVLRGRQASKTYDINSSLNWQWDTDENRERYRQMRVQSDETFNYARFTIAAIVTNHVISAINAGRLAIGFNNNSEASRYHLRASVITMAGHPDGVKLSLTRNF